MKRYLRTTCSLIFFLHLIIKIAIWSFISISSIPNYRCTWISQFNIWSHQLLIMACGPYFTNKLWSLFVEKYTRLRGGWVGSKSLFDIFKWHSSVQRRGDKALHIQLCILHTTCRYGKYQASFKSSVCSCDYETCWDSGLYPSR